VARPKLLDLFRPPAPEAPPTLTAAVFARTKTLTAAARQITPELGAKIAKGSRTRAWQDAAFVYERALPEVGYVIRFLAHNSAHIRLTAADRPRGADQVVELDEDYGLIRSEDGTTVTRDPDALPEDLVEAARDALAVLTGSAPSGGGSAILAPLVANFELAGEAWLVGTYDPDSDRESWGIYSKSEVRFQDGRLPTMDPDGPPGYYRLVTGEGKDSEAQDLDPAYTTVHRMWTADTQWSAEPSSPMRSLAGVCERLLLIERATDAALRSRAAGNGFMLVPDELSPPPNTDDEADEEADEFQADLTTQLITPLSQDGSAASVVPGVLRGPAEYLDKIRHLTVDRPMDEKLAALETRLLARLGIGLDVPPEVITGYADVNHWNVWQVDSDTFKHHQEPITINGCEALTLAYMRSRLQTAVDLGVASWTTEQIERVVIGYDAASLVTPPDQREAANNAYDRGTISGKAHRRILGFDESDAPEEAQAAPDEAIGTTGMSAALLAQVAVIAGNLLRAGYEPDSVGAALGLDLPHTGIVPGATPAGPPGTVGNEQPAITAAAPDPPAPVTDRSRRLSRRLLDIDRQLRERLTTAADAALNRALERAGNRLRSKANGNPEARTASAGVPGERVAAVMGRTLVAALGAEEQELLAEAFERFRGQYTEWTLAAAEEAMDTAAELTGLRRDDPTVMRAVASLRDTFADAVELSWPALEGELLTVAEGALYEPDLSLPDRGEVPATRVPPGVLRSALAVAGGLASDATGLPPLSGLTSGRLLQTFLADRNVVAHENEWAYGISSRPFKPHRDLDGQVFTSWDDPVLATPTEANWIGRSMAPGDHKGCHCDYMPIYSDGARARAELDELGRAAYREQKPDQLVPGWTATVDPRISSHDNRMPDLRRPVAAEPVAPPTALAEDSARTRSALERRAAEQTAATATAGTFDQVRAANRVIELTRIDEARDRADLLGQRIPLLVTRTITGEKTHFVEIDEDNHHAWRSLCNSETPRNTYIGPGDDPVKATCRRCEASAAKRAREQPPPPAPGVPAAPERELTRVGGRKPTPEILDEVRYSMEVMEDSGEAHGLGIRDGEIYISDAHTARRTLQDRASIYEDELAYSNYMDREQKATARRRLNALKALINRIPDV
jgi:hypothetical protein